MKPRRPTHKANFITKNRENFSFPLKYRLTHFLKHYLLKKRFDPFPETPGSLPKHFDLLNK